MAVRIGVVVRPDGVAVSKVDGGQVVWSATVPVTSSAATTDISTIADALSSALARAPRSSWPSPRVNVAIAAPFARVKLVRGVPPVRKRRELLAMLRLNATHYVASAVPVILTGARVLDASEVEVGIADLRLIRAVTEVVEQAKLRIGFVIPAAVLEREADPSAMHATANNDEGDALPERAARLGRSDRLALSPGDNPARVRAPVSRPRVIVAYAALAMAVAAGSYVRVIQTRGRIAVLRAAERRVAPSADSATAELRDLGGLNHSIGAAATFSRQRVSVTMLLAALTDALPAGVAMTTVRIDTATVDIVTLAPRTAAVVDALADVPDVEAATIIGPVSRDAIGATTLERATIRMRLVRGDGHGTRDFAVDREEPEE